MYALWKLYYLDTVCCNDYIMSVKFNVIVDSFYQSIAHFVREWSFAETKQLRLSTVALAVFIITGSASPVLTATHHHHSYRSPRLSEFFRSRLCGSDRTTDIHAKWLKRRGFTQGCAFCGKHRNFSYPLISRPLKGQNFANFWTLKIFARFGF